MLLSNLPCNYKITLPLPPNFPTYSSLSSLTLKPRRSSPCPPLSTTSSSPSAYFIEHLEGISEEASEDDGNWEVKSYGDLGSFEFDESFDSTELRRLESPLIEVKELEELPEQWRRSRLAWLCKELPAHKPAMLVRVLNAQRKWIRQEDVTYIAVHCMRIRENEAAFRVYRWMMQQHWFQFDFALATKLADYMGKERKCLKCREIFDDIIKQGRVPCESTFHILIIAYLSSSGHDLVGEACEIYNRMIQFGGYKPRLSLHNALFRALVAKPGGSCKHFLKQAEFIFHNLTTFRLDIHKDIYGGLVWLHSYQDVIDKERIRSIRSEMRLKGIEESREVLVSILRACSKEGDVDEAERTWTKLVVLDGNPPSQAYVYKMEVYAKVGNHTESLKIFRGMQKQLSSTSVVAYHKIIEILSKARELDLAEFVMAEFRNSALKPLMPSFIDLMEMYSSLSLHDKLESTFFHCIKECRPNRTIYNMYLDSLVKIGSYQKADDIFSQMYGDVSIGVNSRSCNTILRGYLYCGEYEKARKVHILMCQKKFDIDSSLVEKLDSLLASASKSFKKPVRLKLSVEQREILIGLSLGGLQLIFNEEVKNHSIYFQFSKNSNIHSVLRRHIYDQFHEWLAFHDELAEEHDNIPCTFATIPHSSFDLYAEQFWPQGRQAIPKMIYRWLSPQVLAYWYMYGGYKTTLGDILLRSKGSQEGVATIVRALKAKSLNCRVKRKGRVFWLGFLGGEAASFWKLVEPFILDDAKAMLKADGRNIGLVESECVNFDSGSDSDDTIVDEEML